MLFFKQGVEKTEVLIVFQELFLFSTSVGNIALHWSGKKKQFVENKGRPLNGSF